MGEFKKPTIDSIARELGMAKSTVSRALNDYPEIAIETRRRVQEAAHKAGYRRTAGTRRAPEAATNTIGIVVETYSFDISSQFFGQFLGGAVSVLEKRGYDPLISGSGGLEDTIETYERLTDAGKVDGFILTRTRTEDPRVNLLQDRNFPFVSFGRDSTAQTHAWLDMDVAEAQMKSVGLLVELGHRRIGQIATPSQMNTARLRRAAHDEAVLAYDLDFDESLFRPTELTAEDGAATAEALMMSPRPPTAIICEQDVLAIGAMEAIRGLGLKPGRDVSVIGYGDVPLAGFVSPGLTTFSQKAETCGAWSAEMMLAVLWGTTPAILQRIRHAELVMRDSAKPLAFPPEELRRRIDETLSQGTQSRETTT